MNSSENILLYLFFCFFWSHLFLNSSQDVVLTNVLSAATSENLKSVIDANNATVSHPNKQISNLTYWMQYLWTPYVALLMNMFCRLLHCWRMTSKSYSQGCDHPLHLRNQGMIWYVLIMRHLSFSWDYDIFVIHGVMYENGYFSCNPWIGPCQLDSLILGGVLSLGFLDERVQTFASI